MNRRSATIITVVVLVLFTAGWWFMLYTPRQDELATVQTELDTERRQEQTLRAELRRRQDLKAQEATLDLKRATLATFIPDEPALAQFINDATAIAQASGIDFISIAPGLPAAGGAGQGVISLSLSIRGGFFQLLDYMVRMERHPRTVVFDSISLSPAVEEGTVRLSVSVAGRMFMSSVPELVSVPPSVLTATASPAPVAPIAPTASPSPSPSPSPR